MVMRNKMRKLMIRLKEMDNLIRSKKNRKKEKKRLDLVAQTSLIMIQETIMTMTKQKKGHNNLRTKKKDKTRTKLQGKILNSLKTKKN
jgi:hypothetical protein